MVDRADWTFLLQQEGDQSWLPLESPDVEILEGRYRILAKSRYRNAPLSVRLSHVPSLGGTPMSRQRSIRTDGQGLAAVLAFTSLQPGLWHIDCQGDDWHTSVQLHVLEKVEEDLGDWQPDWEAEPMAEPVAEPQLPQLSTADLGPDLGFAAPELGDLDLGELSDSEVLDLGPTDLALGDLELDGSGAEMPADLLLSDLEEPLNFDDPGELDLSFDDDDLQLDGDQALDLALGDLELDGPGAEMPADLLLSDLEEPLNFDDPGELDLSFDGGDLQLDGDQALDLDQALDFETDLGGFDDLDLDLDLPDEDGSPADNRAFDLTEDIRSTTIEPNLHPPDLSLAFELDPIESPGLAPGATLGFPEAIAEPLELSPGTTLGFPEAEAEPLELSPGTTLGFPEVAAVATPQWVDPFSIPDTEELPEPIQDASPTPTELSLTPLPEPSWAESLDDLDFTEAGDALAIAENPEEIDPLGRFAVDSHLSLAQESTAAFAAVKPPVPSLVLDLDLYNITPGQPLNLTGRIAADTPGVLGQSELVAILRDPQAARVVAEQRQVLQNQPLPIPFVLTLPIPADLQAQLLIGELTLWNDGVDVLAQQTFTAIAEPEAVVASLPEPSAPAPKLPLKETPMNQFSGVDFSLFNLIGAAPENVAGEPPTPMRESLRDVDLPSFGAAIEPEPLPDWEDPALADPLADDPLNLDLWGDDLGDPASELDLNLDDLDLGEPEALSLDGPDLQLMEEAEPIAAEEFDFDLTNALFEPAPMEFNAQEVVIDDLPEVLPTPKPLGSEANPLLIPDSEAIPVPTIEVAPGELVTGQAIQVKVILPNILAKLYVKLWIHDRQSRTMLDGPRWLVDFGPNGKEALEAVTQLTVPFGSVEIQIAAIAVEAATKRESYRATVDRTVGTPSLSDDFDFDLNL
jgi:hypothetical protein